MKQRSARSLSQVMGSSPALAEIGSRVTLMAAVQQVLNRQWPEMDLRVLSMRDGVLKVVTRSIAGAAKARQRAPSILSAVQRENPAIQSVRFRTEKSAVTHSEPAVAQRRPREIRSESLESLQMAASALEPGPVKRALERMIRRQLGSR